jgi:hypothetical protein
MAWEPRYPKSTDEIDILIDKLCAAVDRCSMGRYEVRFSKGGHVIIDLDAKPAKRRKAL